MSNVTITIHPEMLQWARERRGYAIEEAARRLDVSSERLQRFEAGDEPLTPAKIRQAAHLYKISPAAFFLPEVPSQGFVPPRDFRTQNSSGTEQFSPKLREEIERVRSQQEILRELAELGSFSPPRVEFPLISELSDERAAAELRRWLAVDTGHFAARDDRSMLRHWITVVERRGIFVGQVSGIKVSEMRGYCLPDPSFPFIVLNGSDAVSGRLFTLAHELVHLSFGEESLCNDDAQSESGLESRCNAIAAALLMPKAEILEHEVVTAMSGTTTGWAIHQLELIGKNFGTSPEAVARRLMSLRRMDSADYRRIRAALQRRTTSAESTSSSGGPDRDVMLLRNLGSEYVRRVINARNQRLISHASVAIYLFSKLKWAEQMAVKLGLPYQ